jgi:hypothetical protein
MMGELPNWNLPGDAREYTKFDIDEKERIYYFHRDEKVVLRDVYELIVSSSGTHYLSTRDGKTHIIPVGWIHIEIDA